MFLWFFIILTPFPVFTIPPNRDIEIAIEKASLVIPEGELCVISDKMQFLKEISQSPFCEDTFHIVDIGKLVDRLHLWKKCLPKVLPYYAVKTNNDKVIISTLAALGTCFDCASKGEMEEIIKLGIDPSRIIFAHPRKSPSEIHYAKEKKIPLLTFDSLEELDKLLNFYPEGQFLLRIKTDDSHSSSHLSNKFGANIKESYPILDAAFSKKAHVVGIAFHVGSNCTYLESYQKALYDAATLFKYCKEQWNTSLSLLDLGGGWPGTNDKRFSEIAHTVNEIIDSLFDPEIKVIAEPGRFFASTTTTIAMRILGKSIGDKKISYYMSNGVFGFFISSLYYGYDFTLISDEGWNFRPLSPPRNPEKLYPSLLWGPTCDSGDKIVDEIYLPEMETGSFFLVENIGAYSYSLQTSFNGIPLSKPYYYTERDSKPRD